MSGPRANEKRLERIVMAVPHNWCDSILTGPRAIASPAGPRDIEKLLRDVQDRVRAAAKKELARPPLKKRKAKR